MTVSDINLLLTGLCGLLVVVGGAVKYMLGRVDEKNKAAASEQLAARQELTLRLHEEIKDLRGMVTKLQSENALYMRRIFALEAYIHQMPGVQELPKTPGWPPEQLMTPLTGGVK